ncbi:hypothetical protein DL767_000206 [Monosporascus sp. MG133]|nr:hypothetical protein DL767_000206 [Monosporascus sp. MG133]
MFRLNLNTWFCHLLEYAYSLPDPPPRKRTKPMEVLCVGMPRSGTESLQRALLRLGYDHTLHGWDIVFEDPNYCQQWVRLCRKKWFGPLDGETKITAADFDALLGHAVAVTDTAGSVFAAELIDAYPDAKVILNYRKDLEHYNMVRGLVPKDRLLEWSVEDGWEPLCKFLGKPVPENEPFPHANAAAGWAGQESKVAKRFLLGAAKGVVFLGVIMVGAGAIAYKLF